MDARGYSIVTAAYWGFTLTDGALRMLVLLHFHELGYSPIHLAFLFLLYEFCGIITNLFGGWIGSRSGLKVTLFAGLATQVIALMMLSLIQPGWAVALSVTYVMAAQALSGIAKDLTKMSSKSAVKLLVVSDSGDAVADRRSLFKWVAVLTGSKNALKGVGFFLGGILLGWLGFAASLWVMAGGLLLVLLAGLLFLEGDLGKSRHKAKFKQLFAKSPEINALSAARFFLFASRDIWFVVGLPVFLRSSLGWSFAEVGGFLAAWVIGYGIVQACAPGFVHGSVALSARMGIAVGRGDRGDRGSGTIRFLSADRGPRRAGDLWHRVRSELGGALLPHPRLHRRGQGRRKRRLLLHGECLRAPGRHAPLRSALHGCGSAGLPVDEWWFRACGGAADVAIAPWPWWVTYERSG